MTINQQAKDLPAYAIAEQLNTALLDNAVVVVTAAPGAGKSTLLPLTILGAQGQGEEGGETIDEREGTRGERRETRRKIVMLEPRRLAARQVAERLADNISEKVGCSVGYTVRFESKVSKDTRIEVVTEGVMMRKLLADPTLDDVDVVIFDEFHERSLTSDVTLALVREIQLLLRPELKIVIMSATIDATTICTQLDAPLIECEGRMYDVDTILVPRERDTTDTESIARDVCSVIHRAYQEHQGDILVFLPGQAEISRCVDLLGDWSPNTMICPLYGMLSFEQQRQAIASSPEGKRKIVLATSIAETSLTIEGIRIVIDSGFCRRMMTDQRTGLSHLETVRISNDMAIQRRGRAGRVAEGICYQLWNSAIALNLKPNRMPEIMDADLSSVVLSIISWGENNIEQLPWLTPPPHANVIKAQQLLLSLGALTALGTKTPLGTLTPLGTKMSVLPCHPRISKMLVMANDNYQKALAADIAALLEERNPLLQNDADINTRIAILRQQRQRQSLGRWGRIAKVADQYRYIIKVREDNTMPDRNDTGQLLAMAYPERIGHLQHNGHYRLSGGDNAQVDNTDQLSAHDWIVVASMNAQSGNVFLASPVDADRLPTEQYDNVSWNSKEGCVVAQREQRIGRLVVSCKPLHDVSRDDINELLAQTALKEGLSMFNFDDKVKMLQRRITSVSEWHPELSIPDISTEAVLSCAKEWLPMYAGKATSSVDLKKIDLTEVIWSLIDYPLQQTIERLAPSHIQMPNGHKVRLDYRHGAEAPVLSVRLQECFGMTDTPCVDDNRCPVLMELLSPGFKPVQLTKDLRSFWATTYFDVRKELRRRYPKHAWPETPKALPKG